MLSDFRWCKRYKYVALLFISPIAG